MVRVIIYRNGHLVKELVWRKSEDGTFREMPINSEYPQLITNYRKYINFNYYKEEIQL